MIETHTVRIAYSWSDRNHPQLMRYGLRQWETGVDEDRALEAACTHLQTPGIMPEKEGDND